MIIIVKHFRLGSCNMVPAKKAGALEASKAGATEKIQELLFDSDSDFLLLVKFLHLEKVVMKLMSQK